MGFFTKNNPFWFVSQLEPGSVLDAAGISAGGAIVSASNNLPVSVSNTNTPASTATNSLTPTGPALSWVDGEQKRTRFSTRP